MTFNTLITLANTYILPFWILMIFVPKWEVTKKVIESYLMFLPLIGLYIYYLFISFDPDLFVKLANPTLGNISSFFSMEGSAGAAWVHFLVADLFVGRWIYLQGQEKNIWIVHSLILCMFFCPAGLLSHIITDTFFSKENQLNLQDSEKA